MVTSRGCVICIYIAGVAPLTDLTHQGQHTDRQGRPRPSGGLWSAIDYLRPQISFILDLSHAGWDGPMDEPGAFQSRTVRVEGCSPNNTF